MKPVSQGQVRTASEEQKTTINVHNGSIVTTEHHPLDMSLKISTTDGSIRITCNVIKRHNYATQFLKTSTGKQGLSLLRVQSCNVVHSTACWPIYHRIKYCRMGCHLSPYSDAAMGQFVESICGFYRLLDSLFILLLT